MLTESPQTYGTSQLLYKHALHKSLTFVNPRPADVFEGGDSYMDTLFENNKESAAAYD
jgi:hypothetical protein